MIQNRSAHEAHLQQGSTNPEYKSTQQDLTEMKTDKTQECRLRASRYGLTIIKVLLRKSYLTKFFISIVKLHKIIYKDDTIRVEIMKLHIQHLHKPYSSSSY